MCLLHDGSSGRESHEWIIVQGRYDQVNVIEAALFVLVVLL